MLDAGLLRGSPFLDIDHEHALGDAQHGCDLIRHVLHLDAHVACLFRRHLFRPGLALQKVRDDGAGGADGDGVAHALYLGAGYLVGIDADDFAVDVQQRAAGVAGVDGRVSLDESAYGSVFHGHFPVQGADDAAGDRLSVA